MTAHRRAARGRGDGKSAGGPAALPRERRVAGRAPSRRRTRFLNGPRLRLGQYWLDHHAAFLVFVSNNTISDPSSISGARLLACARELLDALIQRL
jgi:hypothetical protein